MSRTAPTDWTTCHHKFEPYFGPLLRCAHCAATTTATAAPGESKPISPPAEYIETVTPERLLDIASGMSDDQRVELANMRGGCSCHLSPPCPACCEPLTEDEAEELGLLPDKEQG